MRETKEVSLLAKIGQMAIVRVRKDVRLLGEKWGNGYSEGS